jgi:hypothetical protein
MRLRRRPLPPAQKAERLKKLKVRIAEAMTWLGWLSGWALVTIGIEGALRLFFDSTLWVYPASFGALLAGVAGFRPLGTVLVEGIGFLKSRKS